MRMEVDASDYATEGVLSMECKDGKWRPIVYLYLSNFSMRQKKTIRFIIRRCW